MTELPVAEPLAEILSTYCDVNAFEMVERLAEVVSDGQMNDMKVSLFKNQLLNAIKNETITPLQYKKLTGDSDFPTQEKLQVWLRELYETVFEELPPV
jgi:hypothetical protein